MFLGRISRLYVIILVVWLERTVNLQESFKLFRGYHDVFSNCLPKDDYGGRSICSKTTCREFNAKCIKSNRDCDYCVCNNGSRNTYINDGNGNYRCVKDVDVVPNTGCYKFDDEAKLHLLSYDNCSKSCSSLNETIFAPNIKFGYNSNVCNIDWSKSKYQRHGESWKSVNEGKSSFWLEGINNLKKRLTINGTAFNIWNGSLVKLGITCRFVPRRSGRRPRRKRKRPEKSCVLLKIESLPKVPVFPPPGFTTSTTQSAVSDLSSGSSSTKAIAISIPIILVIVILCLAVRFFFIRRQRKRSEPELTTNVEEMQSCDYEDPSQMYEPLKEDRRGADTEQPYQGLVRLDYQGKNTSDLYDYINDKDITNPENEYSYASNDDLARPFEASHSPPSAQPPPSVAYHTLEKPETSDIPTFECDRLTDKGQHSKNEPFDQQPKYPVYQTLEKPEAVENPKLNLDDELTDKSLDYAVLKATSPTESKSC